MLSRNDLYEVRGGVMWKTQLTRVMGPKGLEPKATEVRVNGEVYKQEASGVASK